MFIILPQFISLFTYFLLKKLQETGGNVTLGELSDYITVHVGQQSIVVNRKSQTPTVSPALAFGDKWINMKLKYFNHVNMRYLNLCCVKDYYRNINYLYH